ncbi:MAG TPA: hypothetical protein VGK06_14825 [Methanosarcina sp.]|jgi:chromosome segregation ATPase
MPQEDNRVRVNGRVPKELYAEISNYYANITAAINDALELLRQEKTGQLHKDCGKNMQNDASGIQAQLDAARMQLDAANMQIDFLKGQLEIKDTQQEARINDLLDQLKVKDQQLEKKDTQIENLTNTMQSQAINIHDMLNQKAIEAPGEKKKPFWKFW